jgi:DNA polymerase-3 subunit beta
MEVNRLELKQALTIVKRTVGGSPRYFPILSNAVLSSGGAGILHVSTTDLELSSLVRLSAVGAEGMEPLCVPLKALSAVVRASKGESITLEALPEFKVRIGGATLAASDPDEYPTLPSADDHEAAECFDAPTLAHALKEVSYAASTDATRYNLNGVFFEDVNDAVLLTATDGHRLAQSRIGAHSLGCGHSSHKLESERRGWIVPLGFVSALEALIGKRKPHAADVRFGHSWQMLSATVGNVTLICKLIDGEYPNYRQVIPERNGRVAYFDRAEFLDRIADVWGCLPERSQALRIKLNGVIELEASNPDVGDAAASVSADISELAQGAEIRLNAGYLRAMLKSYPTNRMTLYLQAPDIDKETKKPCWDCSPLLFASLDSSTIAIVMPMRL